MKVQKHIEKKTESFFCFALITTLSECSLVLKGCSCLLLPLISLLMLLNTPLLQINVGYKTLSCNTRYIYISSEEVSFGIII